MGSGRIGRSLFPASCRIRRESIGVSLVAASVAPPVEAGLAKVVDEFLQHTFRGNDLVVPVSPHRWLVLAKCPQQEIDAMLVRVRTTWAQANENRPAGRLPAITLRAKGTRQIPAGAGELIELFRAEMSAAAERPKGPSVLVVDDDREMLCGLGIRLSASGFEVLTAANGKTGIEAALRHHPDAILMDNYMPVMDGLEALGQLGTHEETSDIPVVMLSASLRDQQKALEQGARFFLQKPCDAETIVAALKEAIGSARARKGRRPNSKSHRGSGSLVATRSHPRPGLPKRSSRITKCASQTGGSFVPNAGRSFRIRAEGPAILPAQGIALGTRGDTISFDRANGPKVRLNGWPVGPKR